MKIGIILLAAGRSERFGSDKRCAPWPGHQCMLKASVENAIASGLDCFVVLHPGDADILAECLEDGTEGGICPDAFQGIGNSIAFGVRANQDWDGWIIARADMPWITPDAYRQLAKRLIHSDCARLMDRFGQPSFPTAFRREHAFELMNLSGHRTEARLIPEHKSVNVIIKNEMVHHDVNYPSDIPCTA